LDELASGQFYGAVETVHRVSRECPESKSFNSGEKGIGRVRVGRHVSRGQVRTGLHASYSIFVVFDQSTPLTLDIRRVSFIDRLDKALSGPIFRIRMPWFLEAAIAVPGSIFGVMVCRSRKLFLGSRI
jgi:hypothetical protein